MVIKNNSFELEASSKNNFNTRINNNISPKLKLKLRTNISLASMHLNHQQTLVLS